ncbi:MAG: prolipoprotein diacylglyceryl transferase [Omnitrophica bacterium]|nr:prolipoprotein diacylglyceryl transferase [Candidatus Omnitrophota bacterium]
MHPILFEFGPLKIYAYGFSLALGFIVGTYLASLEAQRVGLPAKKIIDLSLYLAISGILGARLLYVLQNLAFYISNPGEIFMLHKGGLSFYGGFILATICAIVFLKKEQLSVPKVLDLIAPYLALAQSIGRIGCLLNGCCYGQPTDFGFCIYFPGEGIARHPTQIYSSLSLLVIFFILRNRQTRRGRGPYFSGQIFLWYCLLYSLMRFFMEFLRGDNLRIFANLSLHQLISMVIFVISGVFLWKKKRDLSSRSLP